MTSDSVDHIKRYRAIDFTLTRETNTLEVADTRSWFDGNATLLYAERNTCTIDLKLLPTPTNVKPILWPNLLPKSVPSSLGVRWLAFADSKVSNLHLNQANI
ncbi:unnamed protein product [Trichobilharzia regenti]|nr:unnamed protein product [Trichobilharzia regenti]